MPNMSACAMTPAQQRAQDATAAILRRHCDDAEAHLRALADKYGQAALDRLCPCGIAEVDCQCPLRRDAADARRRIG